MGFNYYRYGCIQPCGIENGKVYHILPSGARREYPCGLNITVPLQTNLYYGETIAFVLEHEGKEYIGRFDGSISVIRKSDGLLVGLNNWVPSRAPKMIECGIYREHGITQVIFLDPSDRQSLYIYGQPMSSKLRVPYNGTFDTVDSILSFMIEGTRNTHVYTEGGEALATEIWDIQTSIRGRDCRIFF